VNDQESDQKIVQAKEVINKVINKVRKTGPQKKESKK
jgi:hypothetical protein